jgi:hypothetical protein
MTMHENRQIPSEARLTANYSEPALHEQLERFATEIMPEFTNMAPVEMAMAV